MKNSIKSAVINELFRIVLFVLYYILLIALGVAVFVAAALYTYFLGWLVVSGSIDRISIKGLMLAIISIIAVWILAFMFGAYLLKPLFAFKKNENAQRVEVKQKDCPDLFAILEDLTRKIGCKMPKHVFLSPDVNACVFYNTSFWSIFFPVRKNLEIGLGLFDGMCVEEVKAIIGHEFGHFSQNSMKVGSVVYVTNTVLYDLTYAEDGWDKKIDEMCISEFGSLRFAGAMTRWLSNITKRMTQHVYRFVQKGYMTLSRQMEYDADEIACKNVGRNVFVSALYKLDTLSYVHGEFSRLFGHVVQNGKITNDYFAAQDVIRPVLPLYGRKTIDRNTLLTENSAVAGRSSRVDIKDVWSSHPEISERVENVSTIADATDADKRPAWILIPDEVKDKVSSNMISLYRAANKDVVTISSDELKKEISSLIEDTYMDEHVAPFFSRKLYLFNASEVDANAPVDYPFTDENKELIAELQAVIDDYNLLRAVKENQVDARYAKFDGIVYKRKKLDSPMAELEKEYNLLVVKVQSIDKSMCAYLLQHSDKEQSILLSNLYECMCYADHMQNQVFPDFQQHRDALVAELNRPVRREENEYYQLCRWIVDFEEKTREIIEIMHFDLLSTMVDAETLTQVQSYAKESHNMANKIDTDELNMLVRMADAIVSMHAGLYSYARGKVSDIAAKYVINN